jgi:F-type H+-transporting ATPase subunit a
VLPAVVGFCGGVALGVLFFAGLWWTVRRGLSSTGAALWFAGSFLLRFAILALGLYALARDNPTRGIAAAVGVVLARIVVVRFTARRRARGSATRCGARCRCQRAGRGQPVSNASHMGEVAIRGGVSMKLSSDDVIFWQHGFIHLNETIVTTWLLMAVLTIGSMLVTRRLSTDHARSRWQNALEIIVTMIEEQIREIGLPRPRTYLPFIGTLFLFVALANLAAIIPGYEPPTGSLSTTAALAICVFIAVPVFGITQGGLGNYLREYVQPTVLMLPFNIIGEFSRTLALAVRLFGNVMSGTVIGAILLSVAPLIFPVLMHALELLTGFVQAYIFAVLATVYIGAAAQARETDKD